MFQQPMLTLLLLVKVAPIWTLSSSSWDESIRADVFRSPALKLAFIHGSPPPSSLSSSLSDYTEISIAKSTCLVPNSWSKNDEMKSDNEEEKKEEESDETLLKAGLAAMSRMSCLFYISGFWTYEFCISSSVRQFHVREDETITAEYILGRIAPASSLVDNGQARVVDVGGPVKSKMIVLDWADGTYCDLLQTPREVRIEVHCHPGTREYISKIQETAVCKYLAVVYTPRLCTASRSFRPQSLVQEVPVNCFVGNDGEIKEFGVGEENGLSPRQVLEARSAKKAKEDLQAEMKKYMQHAESDSSSFPQDQQQGQDPMIKGKRQLGSEPGKVLTFELGDELLKIVTENQAQDGQVNIAFEEDIEALTRRILEYRRRKGTNHDGPEKQPGQEDEEDEEHTEQHVFHHG